MAKEAFISVGYEGKQYMIPAEIARLNATQPGVARDYILELIADETDRKQQAKQRKEESVEAEFENISAKLSKVDGIEKTMAAMQQTIDSYQSANEALKSQIDALESSGSAAGSASAEAREAAFSLANASTVAFTALNELRTHNDRLDNTVERMEARLAELEAAQTKQLAEALASGQQRQRLQQEASNRALDEAAKAEARAAKAEAVAAQALSDAKAAQSLSRNDITRDQLVSIVQDELRASSPRIVDEAVEIVRRDEFGGGSVTGQRMDGDYIRQRRADADAARNIR